MVSFTKIFISLILFLIATATVFGQNVKMGGQVIDAENKETLSGAVILIEGSKTKVIADMDGNFTLNLSPGKYKIHVSMISYETTTETIEVKQETHTELKISLSQVKTVISKEAEHILLKQLITQNIYNKEV